MTAAAEELCVTHSAVSKQIRQIEDWIGQPMFEPNRRQMNPTPAARRISEAAGMAWALIAAAIDHVSRSRQETELKVIAPATFAMRWLLPRLPDFNSSTPSTKIQIRQTHTPEDWLTMPFDVTIRRGGRCPAQFEPVTLLSEQLALVAAPSVVEDLDASDPKALANLVYVEAETRPGELPSWLRHADVTPAHGILRFPHFYIALEAALAGQGAIVAPMLVVEELLHKDLLCDLTPAHRVPGPTYWAAVNPASRNAVAGRVFISWLERMAKIAISDRQLLSASSASDSVILERQLRQ
ncbi:LysR substrate-binding domain-containing protein [Microvirga sp. VF16]|uniref:LysR substrate-binding domain-containing protein n=1 Tax=Microvirga sp. VF16 TaxID=2807101 RepID=UPI00193CD030|nr:LysR substrate-binding domain-containing protein [Microvirga sp. VF16]QRM33023.1 LysR family transcriptional regulator [Microvirga sp. VF16]